MKTPTKPKPQAQPKKAQSGFSHLKSEHAIRVRNGEIEDRCTQYAIDVVEKQIIAGKPVIDACKRHLADLSEGHKRGLYFDVEKANHVIAYYEEVLVLNGGEWEGQPFLLLGWQCFIIGSLFGWMGSDGYRRFRRAYIETGKGSGKSPLAAGIGLYGLTSDNESRAEIYAAATKKDQAMVLFRDAVAMVDQSPELTVRVYKTGAPGREWNLAFNELQSFFRTLSSDQNQSGPRPHISLLDEIHEHRDNSAVEMARLGAKGRRQPLVVMITNSGTGKQSVCRAYHEYGLKVCAGIFDTETDDTFFAFICQLDKKDDPFKNESCWIKANPSLDAGVPGYKYLREVVKTARGMPSVRSLVLRLNFCKWVEAGSPWLDIHKWMDQASKISDEKLRNRKCWGGLDLSGCQDLTAFVLAFEPCEWDKYWRLVPFFWVPGKELNVRADRDIVPYTIWRDKKYLMAPPGAAISQESVIKKISGLAQTYQIEAIAYDRWRIKELKQLADDRAIALPPLLGFGQGYQSMAPAIDEFERLLLSKKMKHNNNPVLSWCISNTEIETDSAGNRKPSKGKEINRIDGAVAAVMAIGARNIPDPNRKNVYTADQDDD